MSPGTFSLSSLTFPSFFSFPLSFVFILWAFNEALLALTEGNSHQSLITANDLEQ